MSFNTPLSPTPLSYTTCSPDPDHPHFIYYDVNDDIVVNLAQGTPTGYTVSDRLDRIITTGTLPGNPPAAIQPNDLALGLIAWHSEDTTQDTGPTFTAGVGANQFAGALLVPGYSWNVSSSSLPLGPSTDPQAFSTTTNFDSIVVSIEAMIKSAPAQTAQVAQAVVVGEPSWSTSPQSPHTFTVNVAPTSTANLLVLLIGAGSTSAVASVMDNAGNVWTRQRFVGTLGQSPTGWVYTTTVANPLSITTITVTFTGAEFAVAGFYEVLGALNTDPIDATGGGPGGGTHPSTGFAGPAAPPLTVTITSPPEGWRYGWHRVRFTGPQSDVNFGDSYGSSNFVVLRDDPHFLPLSMLPVSETVINGSPWLAGIKGLLGIGTSRIDYTEARNPPTAEILAAVQAGKDFWTASGYVDPERPRALWAAFPNGTIDKLITPGSGGGGSGGGLTVLPKVGRAGEHIFITQTAGTTPVGGQPSIKISVYSPDSSTLVETWDNLENYRVFTSPILDGQFITANSTYINAIYTGDQFLAATLSTPTDIGVAYFDGVKAAITALYPDVAHFEGPRNEPGVQGIEILWEVELFQAAVHAGNAAAKAIGPTPVNITFDLPIFCANGGLDFFDALAFHDYNSFGGQVYDIAQFRAEIAPLMAAIATAGKSGMEMWQTESGNDGVLSQIYFPRRARNLLIHQLVWEQYGLTREHNPVWYDQSHGFWGVPVWLVNADDTLQPQCTLYRTLAEETWGQTHNAILDFGDLGNHVFVGSIYRAPSGAGTAVIWSVSAMPDCTITLTVTGTSSPLTVSDCEGNLSTVHIANGRAVLPVADAPTYVRLPTGVTVDVYSCLDWQPNDLNGQGFDSATVAVGLVNGLSTGSWEPSQTIADPYGSHGFAYPVGEGYVGLTTAALPSTAQLTWTQVSRADHLVIFAAAPSQPYSTLLDFDVQTSVDGSTWVTQATVTKTGPFTVWHGSDQSNTGTQYEASCDDQWIFNVAFPHAVSFKAVRLYVRATTYGGAPDERSAIAIGPSGTAQSQYIVLQKLWVTCDANTRPTPVIAS